MQKGCFSAVVFAIGRLERTEKIVGGKMDVELVENNLLKQLGQEGEIGDGSVVFEFIWIKVVFFEERTDDGRFEDIRNRAGFKRSVDDVCDERQ